MLRLLNTAKPLFVWVLVVPERVPLLGLFPIASETVVVGVWAPLPNASRSWTATAGLIVEPGFVLLGCVWKRSVRPVPARTWKPMLSVVPRLVADARSV